MTLLAGLSNGARRRLAAILLGGVLSGVALFSASPALALSTHTFGFSFSGSGADTLVEPTDVEVDQATGDVYVAENAHSEIQAIAIVATGGTYTLAYEARTTPPLPFDAPREQVQEALDAVLPTGAQVRVSEASGGTTWDVSFQGELDNSDVAQIVGDGSALTGSSPAVTVTTVKDGGGPRVEKFSPAGEFIFMLGREVDKTKSEELGSSEGEEDLCTAASGDTCQAASSKLPNGPTGQGFYAGTGGDRLYLAVDNSDGPSNGDFYVGDGSGDFFVYPTRISKYDSSGHLIDAWANSGFLDGSPQRPFEEIDGIAVDLTGELHVITPPHALLEIFEFAPSGEFSNTYPARKATENGGAEGPYLSVDSEGNSYQGSSIVKTPKVSPGNLGFVNGPESLGAVLQAGKSAQAQRIDGPSQDLYATVGATSGIGGEVQRYPDVVACEPLSSPCSLFESFGAGELNRPGGVAVDDASGDVYVADTGHRRIAVFKPEPFLPNVAAIKGTGLSPSSERLEGEVIPAAAGPITGCRFDYGTTTAFSAGSLPCNPPVSSSSPLNAPTPVSAEAAGLSPSTTYRLRLVASNANGENDYYSAKFKTLPERPAIAAETVSAVHADSALVHAQINAQSVPTTYHVEYGTTPSYGASVPVPDASAGQGAKPAPVAAQLSGLNPATTYHYRLVAHNEGGSSEGPDRTFTTLPFTPLIEDSCPNAHVRQQTGASSLLDCRAYELVSAADTAGYDVESSLIPGGEPFASYPQAQGRALYGIHDGGIPGVGDPTNRGVDPYLATRGQEGWSTEYVGIPADATPSTGPFSSTLLGADAALDTFAFGGSGICSPCFAEDDSTGIPVRMPNGALIQGMAGEIGETGPTDGLIAKPLSANGEHLIFGSTTAFATGGNEETGDVSIYDRNLKTGRTHVVSNTPEGEDFPEPIPCLQGAGKCHAPADQAGIAELDVSSDGSHILLGQKVSTDAEGNDYFHLYMDVDDSIRSIDLTPGAADGVLFDGMTSDGSKVFFTTKDQLLTEASQDEDQSADLYLAEVSNSSGPAILKRISTGSEGTGNTDACDPLPNSVHAHWNSLTAEPNCDAVAIGGGGGVASALGSIYFLSPELLDGSSNGTRNAPNLYLAGPSDGYAPRYVATLESVLTSAFQPPRLRRSFARDSGAFANATGLAVDHQTGDLYVLDVKAKLVEKFDSSGNLVKSFGDTAPTPDGHLKGTETPAGFFSESATAVAGLAVDEDRTSPSHDDLYVPDFAHKVLDKFDSTGRYVSQIALGASPSGVAVSPLNGNVYVAEGSASQVSIFSPAGTPVSSFKTIAEPLALAIDSEGDAYVANGKEAAAYGPGGKFLRTLDPNPVTALAFDSSTGDLYADEGSQVARFDSSGKRIETLGQANLSSSTGLAIDPQGNLYATEAKTAVAVFTPSLAPDPSIDSPVVVDALDRANTRDTADFQVTPDGNYAAFPSTSSLTGEVEPAGHTVLYRYDAGKAKLACVSCTPSGAPSAGDSSLASNGLSLTDDGRVFFTSADQLTAADTDNREDAYEWEPQGTGNCQSSSPSFDKATAACIALISSGTSPFDSVLLGASSNAVDADFFTRDSLAPQDEDGPTVKLYDARSEGGFPYTLPEKQCQASDECHGAASKPRAPQSLSSIAGAEGNLPAKSRRPSCRKGYRRKHGRCVKKPHHTTHHHQARGGHR